MVVGGPLYYASFLGNPPESGKKHAQTRLNLSGDETGGRSVGGQKAKNTYNSRRTTRGVSPRGLGLQAAQRAGRAGGGSEASAAMRSEPRPGEGGGGGGLPTTTPADRPAIIRTGECRFARL